MSRDAILAKIDKANTGRTSQSVTEDANALIDDPQSYRLAFDDMSVFERFKAKATSETVTATVEILNVLSDVPKAVSAYLRDKNLAQEIALQPRAALTDLDWSGIATVDTASANQTVAITFAEAGIAETGSLVFQTAPDAPVLLNFLPLHHLVVLRTKTIKRYMEEVFDHFGTEAANQKRSLNIITGTSGTADIEAKNVRGAHGPRFMHIYCIDG